MSGFVSPCGCCWLYWLPPQGMSARGSVGAV